MIDRDLAKDEWEVRKDNIDEVINAYLMKRLDLKYVINLFLFNS
jgi:hypothetical protein